MFTRHETSPRHDWRSVAWRFALVFVPLMLVSGLVIGALQWHEANTEREILKLKEAQHVNLQAETIIADFQAIVADLRILAGGRTLQEILDEDTPQHRAALAQDYRGHLQHRQLYDQVRLIDTEGMEVVRINFADGRAVIVPEDQLQNKKDRYYVSETLRLERHRIFVSPLDLNVEEGQIETPWKPTIRFGTPVFDGRGRKRGIVVLNYLGAKLLEKLRGNAAGAAGQALLLNSDGYYLAGPTPGDEWGFMLKERRDRTMASDSPQAWSQIALAEASQITTPGGIYTFRTVHPLRELRSDVLDTAPAPGQSPEAAPPPYAWKVVSHVRPATLREISQRFMAGFLKIWLGLGVVLAVAAGIVAWLSLQNQWARQRLLQRERLAAIGEAMTALAHECRNALQRSKSGLEVLESWMQNNAKALAVLGEVNQAQQYLTDLYEEVRGYAAPIHLRREPTDLEQLLRTTWEHLISEHRSADARLVTDSPAVDKQCEVDPRAIGQVLRNILENALAATTPAEVHVAWTETEVDGRPALRIAIRDNGPGLPPGERARVFEPFFTTKLRGTGLGLAISRRFVEAHGGRIGLGADGAAEPHGPPRPDSAEPASSGKARGAEFVIDLPRRSP
jgi:signal transduction histidine kinase